MNFPLSPILLLFYCLIFLSFSPSGPSARLSHAAIIHNLDATHFTSDLHITGDLYTGNYQNAPLESLKVNVSNCEGTPRLTGSGSLAVSALPVSYDSPGIIVDGRLYFMKFEGLSYLDLDGLELKVVPGLDTPYIPSGGNRARQAMFSPRNQDALLYIAAGNDDAETMHYYSTWALDVRQMQWVQKASHDFLAVLPTCDCTLDRCYVYGGAYNITVADTIMNTFYEYDYQKDEWKNLTTSEALHVYVHGFTYLPHKDVMVSYGGIGYHHGSSPSTRAFLPQVSLYHFQNSSWVQYWDPPHVGDKIPTGNPYVPVLPLAAVYNDAIYIATAMLPAPSRLLKLTFEEPVPTFHHIILENDDLLPKYSRGQIGGLIGDHFLVVGGVWSDDPNDPETVHPLWLVGVISLC